jgi:hypothetical protein
MCVVAGFVKYNMSTTITSVAKKRKADEGEVFTLTVSV